MLLSFFVEKGIFRLAPDAGECDHIKSKMNSGGAWIDEKTDVNVFANLLKVWFRGNLFHSLFWEFYAKEVKYTFL